MLVIDGRQASSLGATYSDLIKVMVEYSAVNAINLDGGSSSLMYYRGNYLNNGVVLTGSREMPTAFIVR
jgi:bla regulator protein BlaR1